MEFKVVTYEQLSDLDSSHPQFAPVVSADTRRFYSSCPDISPDFPLFCYLIKDAIVVSQIGLIPDLMTDMQGRLHRWAWSGGLVTKPEFRGSGLATHLIRKLLDLLKEKQILRGSAYSAHETLHIYKKLSGSVIGYAQRYLLLRTIRPVLRRYIGNGFLLLFLDFLYRSSYLSLVMLVLKFRSKYGNCQVQKVIDRASLNAGDLNLLHENMFSFNSSIEKLFWKLSRAKNDPEMYLVRDFNDRSIGYFIVRKKYFSFDKNERYSDYSLMTLMDYGCCIDDRKKSFEIIFEKVIFMFLESGADVLEIVSSSDDMLSCAKKSLFIRGGRGMSFTFSDPGSFDGQDIFDLKRWHLTSFCGDAFTYK